MHLAMKIQPLDFQEAEVSSRHESVNFKSRFRRIFDRQFSAVLKISALPDKTAGAYLPSEKSGLDDFECSSLYLDNMVQNFMEGSVDKPPKGAQSRCNCFNVNGSYSYSYSSYEEYEPFGRSGESNIPSSPDAYEVLKGLVPCACVLERNLLADTARIVENSKICKRKDTCSKQMVIHGLLALGYDASICKSRWEKSPSFPAGEYEYMDVIIDGKRMIIDIDFRSEFEIARSTKAYKSILQLLPIIFVGKADRLEKIITIVSEAARQSLKKKGMHFPPWRQAEYVKSKWLSPHNQTPQSSLSSSVVHSFKIDLKLEEEESENAKEGSFEQANAVSQEPKKTQVELKQWELPVAAKPRASKSGCRISSGLASVMED